MPLKENHLARAVAADARESLPHASSDDASRNGLRSWILTIAISAAVLATMYGLAYWNEARGEASRAFSATSQNVDVSKGAETPPRQP